MPSGFELDLLDRGGYLVNLGYSSEGRTAAEITFARAGRYRLSGVRMYVQPMAEFDSLVGALQARGLENAVVENGMVSGTVSLDGPAVMVFAVPASAGWSANVDGAAAETLASAGALLAVRLDAGTHEIELTYRTPWLREGAAVSAASLAALAAGVYIDRRKRKGVSSMSQKKNAPNPNASRGTKLQRAVAAALTIAFIPTLFAFGIYGLASNPAELLNRCGTATRAASSPPTRRGSSSSRCSRRASSRWNPRWAIRCR